MKANTLEAPVTIFSPILIIAFINFVILILVFIVFYSFFATPAGIEIQMPTVAARTASTGGTLTIRINAENVLFLNDKVVTLSDLRKSLLKLSTPNQTLYVQVDSRASMARVADVWEMCKGLGVAQVKVSTF